MLTKDSSDSRIDKADISKPMQSDLVSLSKSLEERTQLDFLPKCVHLIHEDSVRLLDVIEHYQHSRGNISLSNILNILFGILKKSFFVNFMKDVISHYRQRTYPALPLFVTI